MRTALTETRRCTEPRDEHLYVEDAGSVKRSEARRELQAKPRNDASADARLVPRGLILKRT
jgi:hypothetical protein